MRIIDIMAATAFVAVFAGPIPIGGQAGAIYCWTTIAGLAYIMWRIDPEHDQQETRP